MFQLRFEYPDSPYKGKVLGVDYTPVDFSSTTREEDEKIVANLFSQFQTIVGQYHSACTAVDSANESYQHYKDEVIRQSKEKLSAATRIEVLCLVPFVTFGRMTNATDGRITLWSDPDGNKSTALSINYLWLELDTFPIEEEKGTWHNLVNVAEFYHRKGWRIVDGHPELVDNDIPF